MKKVMIGMMAIMSRLYTPGEQLLSTSAKRKRRGMALVKLGGGVADIRGSIGGTVFSRNRFGAIARNRTIPVDPGTSLQSAVRALMGQVRDAYFNTLTDAQRQEWETYAANVEMTNRLGETINLTGYNMYCRSNIPLLQAGLTRIDDGPSNFTLAEQDGSIVATTTASSKEISLAFDDTADWCDEDDAALLVYESRPMSPGINFFKGPFRYLGKVEGDSVTAPTSPQTFTSTFEMSAGQKQFYQFRIVRADGRLSAPFRCSDIIG